MDTSGINLPEGEDLKVKEVKKGVYEVENAYEGTFEYFDGKPIPIMPTEKCAEPGEPPPVDTLLVTPPVSENPAPDKTARL